MHREASLLRLLFRRQSLLFWYGAFFFTLGLALLGVAVVSTVLEQRYQTEGEIAEGIVLSKDIRPATRDGNRRTEYRVAYRFTTRSGEVVEGRDAVSRATWEALRERDPVTVQYLPDDPSHNRVAGTGDRGETAVLVLFGGVFGVLGAVFATKVLRRVLAERRLLRDGQSTSGTVTDVRKSNVRINRRVQWVIHYRYQDGLGQTHDGQSGYLSSDEAQLWRAGDRGTVLFDPRRPADSLWLGEEPAGGGLTS